MSKPEPAGPTPHKTGACVCHDATPREQRERTAHWDTNSAVAMMGAAAVRSSAAILLPFQLLAGVCPPAHLLHQPAAAWTRQRWLLSQLSLLTLTGARQGHRLPGPRQPLTGVAGHDDAVIAGEGRGERAQRDDLEEHGGVSGLPLRKERLASSET